jgi:hypothetical protein
MKMGNDASIHVENCGCAVCIGVGMCGEQPKQQGHKSAITHDMELALIAAKKREDDFWERNGFPGYSTVDEKGSANSAHRAWVLMCSENGAIYKSPMARQMFVLGWLEGGGKL